MKFPTVFFFLLMLVVAAQCQSSSDVPMLGAGDKARLEQFQKLPAAYQLSPAPANEPGTPLLICGALLRKEGQKPIPNASILLYHTDAKGDYHQKEKGKPETSRISGKVQTDAQGRFYVFTILPGRYNNKGPGGHIHLQVEGARPKGYTFQFSQYSSASDKQFIADNDQFFLVSLKEDKKGRLVGFFDLPVTGW